tara:strand:+ start:416 stop:850 length:435 start_codon:yes stop_codon:yes gene_type:complete
MNCYHCEKNIQGKPWNHLTNIKVINEDDKCVSVDKYICSYICYRRLDEKNKLPKNLWNHIVNKEDYKGLISPIIPKKNTFQYLTHEEIMNLNENERIKYYNEKEDQIEISSELVDFRNELEREEQRIFELEEYSSSDTEIYDDY